jgi:hypothetical protein
MTVEQREIKILDHLLKEHVANAVFGVFILCTWISDRNNLTDQWLINSRHKNFTKGRTYSQE